LKPVTIPWEAVVLVALGALLTLPFWGWGPGAEEDAWGHILTMAQWENGGLYIPSRPPGHPVYEALSYPLYRWIHPTAGPIFLSALALGFAALALFRWMGSTGKAFYGSLLFLVSFPALYAGTVALDYSLSLALGLWSAIAFRKNQPGWAGLLLGLAGGSRLTFLLFALAWFQSPKDLRRKELWQAGGLAIVTLLAVYAIPVLHQGFDWIHTYRLPYPDWKTLLYRMANKGTGLLAFPVLLYLGWRTFRKPGPAALTGWAFLVLFAIYPHKGIFLLPVWALWIAARWTTFPLVHRTIAFVLVLLSPHLFHLSPPQDCPERRSATWQWGQRTIQAHWAGPLWGEMQLRRLGEDRVNQTLFALDTLKGPATVIAGVHYAHLTWKFMQSNHWPAATVVYYCNADAMNQLTQLKTPLYHLPGQDQLNNRVYGIDYTSTLSKPLLADCP
jgi:hypothetical protein